jgi:hypothetical protein
VLYLVDPAVATKNVCLTKCDTYCGIKPCYGVWVWPVE